ncbi:hypothetical protein B0T10DRAFT_64795 [Thelonectria olida]|uniref:USP domain-containing protein n=1 Tax=Thelonectria olida TaxID=1576542 RepID=A0A9P8W2F7_9HYPO|nr:hypothetical protein B0T10DRAFT_64795 [Thelonectria olida]
MPSLGHTRSASSIDSRINSMATNGFPGPSQPNGRYGGDHRPGGASIPHIDDILQAPLDIDANQSIRKLLDSAETSLRHAEISRDLNRPAVALKEFLRASIIAVKIIQSHRDFAFLKGEHKDLDRAHKAFLSKIQQQNDTFTRIKQDIIADNRRTGVKPTGSRVSSSENSTGSRPASPMKGAHGRSLSNVTAQSRTNGSPAKTKPAIQPKPQALHGNAINVQDLKERFRNLRGPQASPGQDPRIKTHPIDLDIPPKPAGPRPMPPPPSRPPKIDINTGVPSLPKLPDPIYSPARGSVSGETPRLPSSTPRNTFARTGSVPGTPTATSQTQSDYFANQSYSNTAIPPTTPANAIRIPQREVITAEELRQAMACKGSILIIDARVRDDFNEGHIMAQSVICIEPSVLHRENLSADEIADSLVLSPNNEDIEFEARATKDLVVFYDQDSEVVPRTARSSDDISLMSLKRALVDFNFGNELKNPPKLLEGGLDAWVDLMGRGSLQSISQAISKAKTPPKRTGSGTIARRKTVVKPHKPDIAKAWEETIKNEDLETASSPSFVRTQEEFHKRFPPVLSEKESMTSPVQPRPKPTYGSSHQVDLQTDLPSPPTRPAPALPRPSYNGLPVGENENDAYGNTNAQSVGRPLTRVPTKPLEQQSTGDNNTIPTGLNNPGNWCYANSLLQCLLASPGFGQDLQGTTWMEKYKAPKKAEEKIENPQLMTKIISNLFHWMKTGKFQFMKAQTLMEYVLYLSKQGNGERFGSDAQQDAQEFMTFLLDHLHDETNRKRDFKSPESADEPNLKNKTLLQASMEFWEKYSRGNQSIVDHSWRSFNVEIKRCLACDLRSYRFEPFEVILAPDIERNGTLDEVLAKYVESSVAEGYKCDTAGCKGRTIGGPLFCHAPPLLCVSLKRFVPKQTGGYVKSSARLTWDLDVMDFTPYFVQPTDGDNTTDPAFRGPFRYETYAIIVHDGPNITAGHYYAYIRDINSRDPYAWFCFNDTNVRRVRIGSSSPNDLKNTIFGPVKASGRSAVPYLLFFRRKPSP